MTRAAKIAVQPRAVVPGDATVGALAGAPASPMGGVPPAGLAEVEVGVTPAELLPRLVPPLVREVLSFASEGFAPFAARYAARDALKDRELRLSDGSIGSACGVAEDGALLVRVNGQLRRVDSAEVSVRPC